MDFTVISLTMPQYRRLKELAEAKSGLVAVPEDSTLVNKNLASQQFYWNEDRTGGSFYVSINHFGRDYLVYEADQKQTKRRESWRFYLSTFLAVLALIIAVIALGIDLWQLGLL